jgi:hypothetical protein
MDARHSDTGLQECSKMQMQTLRRSETRNLQDASQINFSTPTLFGLSPLADHRPTYQTAVSMISYPASCNRPW